MRSLLVVGVFAGLCAVAVHADFVNGDFNGSTGWTVVQEGDGSAAFPNVLQVVGSNDQSGPAYNGASQDVLLPDSSTLWFELLLWSPTDIGYYDVPYVAIDGSVLVLNNDGTLDALTYWDDPNGYWTGGDTVQDLNNDFPYSGDPFDFHHLVSVPGPTTVNFEFGVFSSDSDFGAGTAEFDLAQLVVVPEPSSWLMLALGIGGVFLARRKKK